MDREQILIVIKSNIRAIIEGARSKQILETNSMRDFGADSLEIVEVVSRSMIQLRIRIPRSRLVNVSTIGDLADEFVKAANSTRVLA